ncbi:MAG: hypothetical protein PUB20_00205 [Clostridia bacterium]|nr:hypothetical protein [Clostridia bacterium]
MANKKKKPAAGKSVAGKNNSDKKVNKSASVSSKSARKKALNDEKEALKVIKKNEKAQLQKKKKSDEIRKMREKKQNAERKMAEKEKSKTEKIKKRKSFKKKLKKFGKKIKYYTSKDFLGSFNYVRIFLFIILPVSVIVAGCAAVSQSVAVNVPSEIRNFEFTGRTESELTALKSEFNEGQKQALIDSTDAKGSGKFDFYIDKTIYIDDDFSDFDLCFGNPNSDCILIATIYDSDGNVIYRSLGVEPETEIKKASLFNSIPYGEQKMKVCVNAYDSETNEKIGTKYAKIKLAVGVR